MSVLLDLVYLLMLVLASPWLLYRLVATGEWRSLPQRFGAGLGPALADSIWLHGASAGEVALLKPVVARLERDLPGVPILVSAYTSTGLSVARDSFGAHTVIAFPIDFSFVVKRLLRRFDPALVVVVESELWPNFLRAVSARGVPAVVLNGKMSEKSYALHTKTRLMSSVLANFALIAVQRPEHAERFRSLGVPDARIAVTGNMKYDLARARPTPGRREALRARLGFDADDVVLIGGSLHEGEDAALIDAFASLSGTRERLRLILAPRYPADASRAARLLGERGYRAVHKTSLDRAETPLGAGAVLVVDTVGELGALYAAADIAFVGGSLFYRGANKGGHNLMEPAILGLPVLFGPYNFSFRDTVDALLEASGGRLVSDGSGLAEALAPLCDDAALRTAMGERARQVILDGQGATERNFELIGAVLRRSAARLQPTAQARTMPPASSDSGS